MMSNVYMLMFVFHVGLLILPVLPPPKTWHNLDSHLEPVSGEMQQCLVLQDHLPVSL